MTTIPYLKCCTKCGEDKPLDQFHKDKSRRDGYRDRCKDCIRAYQAEWLPRYVMQVQQQHADLVLPETKPCTVCGIDKPLIEYHKTPNTVDGVRPICKVCACAYQEQRRIADGRDQRRATRTEAHARRMAAIAQRRYGREQQRADPAYQAEQRRKKRGWKKTNHALAQRRKRRAERYQDPAYRDHTNAAQRARFPRYQHMTDRARARHKERYNNDLAYRKAYNARVNIANHKRRLLIDNGGTHTEQEWNALCAQYNHQCLCCNEIKPLTKDHVLPLSLGGDNTINNLQPLCLACNLRKHAKHIDYRPNHPLLG